MIISKSKINKHRVIIDMRNDFEAFWLGHCIHIRTISPTTLSLPILSMSITAIGIEKKITSKKMIKKSPDKNMTDFW